MAQHAAATRRTAPIHPRRISGPTRRVAPAVALPAAPSLFERVRALPEHRAVDRLLRGRACILVIGVLLGGIVAMQVSLLRLNSGISRAVATQSTLERQNADLESSLAVLTSGDRIREGAVKENMIDPQAGRTSYLHTRSTDVERAVKRMRPPSPLAVSIMNNGGIIPGSLNPSTTTLASTGATTPVAAPVTAPVTATTAAATPVPTPVATPVATVAPTATTVPPVQPAPGTAAAAAPTPQG